MFVRAAILGGALALMLATTASAQIVTGRVVRIDPQAQVIVLEDGRMFQVAGDSAILIDNRPAPLATVQPGATVTVQAPRLVTLQDGRYVMVTTPVATTVTPGVRQTVYGRVADINREGRLRVKTDRDEFDMLVSPDAVRHVKKGDTVTMEVTISPAR